jgi:hypothetical protein
LFNAIFPIALLAIGYLVKITGLLKEESAEILTRLVFYVTLPCTVVIALTSVKIDYGWIYLPISSLLVGVFCYGISYLIYRGSRVGRKRGGAFIIGSSSMNTGLFMYPFFSWYLGNEGLARIAFFDVGQIVLLYGLAYYIALTYGGRGGDGVAKKLLTFPSLYAVLVGLILNLTGTPLGVFEGLISMIDGATIPLIMIALGMSLKIPEGPQPFGWVASSLAIRFGISFVVASVFIALFRLEGLDSQTVLIGSMAPPAVTTLIYSVEEGWIQALPLF